VNPDRRPVVWMITLLLAACLLLSGCQVVSPPSTPTFTAIPSLTPTPTEGPILQCTAPYCWEDEVFSCPGKCPGGCGTICATRTPDPNVNPSPTFPPLADVCALPTPNPDQTGPHMDLCASAEKVHINETIQLAVEISSSGYMDFVSITGQDVDDPGNFYVRARSGDHFPAINNAGAHLNLVMVQTHDDQIFLLLQAVSAGAVKIEFRVIPTVPDVQSSITLTVLP